ncbi:MAG: 16S rRNA (guanine(527)-N(7))-methyltransferase [Rhodocyclales bacterium RIFCSPLOWO2_02_FULL_63_24]|nr:MAG: 16S rRNA (guanine(527)-N(7))-methyltransferase [Rhodocyclales bacterium RIFCSPLOWO2_02_FULL_63_24]
MSLAEQLQAGLAALGLDLPEKMQTSLLAYVALLKKWNRTYNLTAIREESEMLTQHLLDSLSVLPVLQESALAGPRSGIPGRQSPGRRWADVGSGAGLPGIPLAIARPDIEMTLIEAVEKKSAFQRQAKIELGLPNITVLNTRVEDVPGGSFDAVVSRAFAELASFVDLAGHLLTAGGRLYAMKGLAPEDEINRLPLGWRMLDCIRLSVPGLDAERHLIVLEKV